MKNSNDTIGNRTRFHLVLRLRMGGAIQLLSLYAFMAWTGATLLLHLLHKSHACTLSQARFKIFQVPTQKLIWRALSLRSPDGASRIMGFHAAA
jgi:hypothetical protein